MQEIYSLDFSRDGRFLVSGSGDKSARVWDVEKGTCVFDLRIEDFIHNEHGPIDAGITSVACKSASADMFSETQRADEVVSPDGKLVAAGSLDTMVRVWNVATGQQLERLKGHKDSVYSWVQLCSKPLHYLPARRQAECADWPSADIPPASRSRLMVNASSLVRSTGRSESGICKERNELWRSGQRITWRKGWAHVNRP